MGRRDDPYFFVQWYRHDWMTDYDVQSCSPLARLVWFEMLMTMFDGPRFGYFRVSTTEVNDKQIESKTVARLCRVSEEQAAESLAELELNKVFSRDCNGYIYSRRIVKEVEERNKKAEAGRKGGLKSRPKANAKQTGTYPITSNHKPVDQESSLRSDSSTVPDEPTPVEIILTFPTVKGKKSKGESWVLTREQVTEFEECFPGTDVLAECRKALAWIKAKSGNRKTETGMLQFLTTWLIRATNSGRSRKPETPTPGGSSPMDKAL